MPGPINLTNQRFGKLVALKPTKERQHKSIVWECQCDCGKIHYVSAAHLRDGSIQSCGCSRKESAAKFIVDLKGKVFGKLTVLEQTDKRKNKSVVWLCQCECGNLVEVESHSLNRGKTQSCGCLKSKGEYTIIQILTELNINFEYQKTFEKCKIDFPLKFDFYLPDFNLIIEYDGEQHFKPIKGLGGEERFKEQQFYDTFKNNWCLQNNIKIFRIPYTDFSKLNKTYINNILTNL